MKHLRSLSAGLAAVSLAVLAGCGEPEEKAKATTPAPVSTSSSPTSSASTTPSSTTSTKTSTKSTSTTSKPTKTSTPTATRKATSAAPQQVQSGTPARLEMPSLGFDEPVRALGLNNGAINPPPHVVQWYTASPKPGATGISVIAGHVAPYGGQAGIFSKLPQLSVGDTVTIGYAGGGERTFKVYAKEAVGKKALQRDARVWGKSSKPVIALITCDDEAASVNGHSVRNYVVWAQPV